MTAVLVERETLVLVEQEPRIEVLTEAEQGPPGPPGPIGPAGGSAFELTAATAISALRVVWEDANGAAHLLDVGDSAHIDLLAGLTTTAADSGGTVRVQRLGPLDAAGLGLSPGRVWLGANGALTQVAPTESHDVLVGYATDDDRIYLSFSEPIELEE